VLILRLKRCERALAAGRLDEATELLAAADARAHRRGQELLDQLVVALVERGRRHLADGRLGPADADADAAARLAGNTPEIADLRAAVERTTEERRRGEEDRRHATAAVRRLVGHGQFTLAGDLARAAGGSATDRGGVKPIVADIAVRRASLDRLVDDASAALGRGDWEAAVRHLAAARTLHPSDERVRRLTGQAVQRVADEVRRRVVDGHLDDAASALRRAELLGAEHAELERLGRGLDRCRHAWQCVRDARYREAGEALDRVASVWPGAGWIATASQELRRACQSIDAVRGGALGVLEMSEASVAQPRPTPAEPQRIVPVPASGPDLRPRPSPRRFLLHVDGAGSFLVLQGDTITVGRQSAARPVNLPLVTAETLPTVTFARTDEDYFLTAAAPVPVNDRAVASKLLAGGDRIAVGPRGRIEFRRPNAASGTAVLRVGGLRLPWGPVRDVLWMDREIVMGASAAAHVRVHACPAPVILQATGDGLLCRADDTIRVDGRPSGRAAPVADGARVCVGALSFVVCRE
jgi:hypothetical protein